VKITAATATPSAIPLERPFHRLDATERLTVR